MLEKLLYRNYIGNMNEKTHAIRAGLFRYMGMRNRKYYIISWLLALLLLLLSYLLQ